MKRKQDGAMQICARLYDEELIENLRGLVSQGKFHSVSEIVGRCIELALPVLTGRAGKSGNDERREDTAKAVKQQTAVLRELSVQTAMAFNLLVGLFRERELALNGVRTNGADLAGGKYEVLSEYYQDRMNELMKLL